MTTLVMPDTLTDEMRAAGATPGEPSTGWRGKTIYRRCSCSETAHDAKYMPSSQAFAYLCRNCGRPWPINARATETP